MFEIINIGAFKINNILTIGGEKRGSSEKYLKIGSLLSDGENIYEISGIPFVRYKTVEDMKKNICLTLNSENVDIERLQGKTLRLIQN